MLSDLRPFRWDSDVEYVDVTGHDVREVLDAYEAGRMSAQEVEDWADALEVREDVAMSEEVREGIFRLANPVLGYELSASLVEEIKRLLEEGP